MNTSVRSLSPGLEFVGDTWIRCIETYRCHLLTIIAVHMRLFHNKIHLLFVLLQKLRSSFELLLTKRQCMYVSLLELSFFNCLMSSPVPGDIIIRFPCSCRAFLLKRFPFCVSLTGVVGAL